MTELAAGGAPTPAPGSIAVSVEGGVAVVRVEGVLDGDLGRELAAAARSAIGPDITRLDVDLRDIAGFDSEGTASLLSCRAVAATLAEGLHWRTGRGAGRQALLQAHEPA